MTKDQLVTHLRSDHAATITEPKWTTKAWLDELHRSYHALERVTGIKIRNVKRAQTVAK